MLKLNQLIFDFKASLHGKLHTPPPPSQQERAADLPIRPLLGAPAPPSPSAPLSQKEPAASDVTTADAELTEQCRALLVGLGLDGAAKLVQVVWNPRLRSTAGYAKFPSWVIELNPKLRDFEGQVDRTMKHELAHLVAYLRAGRRRIEPHGGEWQRACADLGIPNETARHTLPLPRREVRRNYAYSCPSCSIVVRRVRKFRRFTACSACCKKHSGGQYDSRFRFVLVEPSN